MRSDAPASRQLSSASRAHVSRFTKSNSEAGSSGPAYHRPHVVPGVGSTRRLQAASLETSTAAGAAPTADAASADAGPPVMATNAAPTTMIIALRHMSQG